MQHAVLLLTSKQWTLQRKPSNTVIGNGMHQVPLENRPGFCLSVCSVDLAIVQNTDLQPNKNSMKKLLKRSGPMIAEMSDFKQISVVVN